MDYPSNMLGHEPLTDERRADLRARGYKPVELWVLNRESPAFKAELRRQAKIVAIAPTVDEYGDIDAFTEEMTRQAWADLPDYDWSEARRRASRVNGWCRGQAKACRRRSI